MLNLSLNENDAKKFNDSIEQEMSKCIKHFERELAAIRTGRAHASMVENIGVNAYSPQTMTPLKTLSAISAPEADMIIIQPWDQSTISAIEKAILQSELGVTPINDGNILRIKLPKISSERRQELKKNLHKKMEEAKISIRGVRKDFHNLIRDSKKNKSISEDFSVRLGDNLNKITDRFVQSIESITVKKEKDVQVF